MSEKKRAQGNLDSFFSKKSKSESKSVSTIDNSNYLIHKSHYVYNKTQIYRNCCKQLIQFLNLAKVNWSVKD